MLAGVLPLDLRLKEVAALYEAKKGIALPELADREAEQMDSALEMPHPAEQERVELCSLIDEEQYTESKKHAVKIYTDGSKIEGKVGASFSLWRGDTESKSRKFALPSYCTVYQAELFALSEAMREILRRHDSDFAIFSDSMAALQTISNPATLHPLAVGIRDALRQSKAQSKSVKLYWIKAHVGFEGNERADALAKAAAIESKRKPDYDLCPVSYIKRMIREGTLHVWDRRYGSGETAGVTRMFFPSAIEAYKVIKKLKITPELTQALTGHGGFAGYLTRFKCKENPACACDPIVDETFPHLLLDCPQHDVDRFNVENLLDIKITKQNLPEIIKGKESWRLIELMTKIVVQSKNRNK